MKKEDSIQRLVELSIQGNEQAFSKLCRLKGQQVLYRCIQLMGNVQDGEDAAQEVFIRMYSAIRRLKSPEAFQAWLHKLIFHTCSKIRGAKIYVPLEEVSSVMAETKTDMLPEAYLLQEDKRQVLLEIVHSLPASMKDCILLYYYEDMTAREIGEVMDIDEASVNMQLYRARLKIRAALEKKKKGAYASYAMVPFAGISALLKAEAASVAPMSSVQSCVSAAGFGRPFWMAGKKALSAVRPAVWAVAATAFVILSVVALSVGGAGDGTATSADGDGGSNTVDAEQGAPSSGISTAFLTEKYVIIGSVYLKDFGLDEASTWYTVQGATVQLYSKDGKKALGEPVAADGADGFVLNAEKYGKYRVLIALPEGACFVSGASNIAILNEGNTAWLVWQGSEVITLDENTPALTGIAVATYYPAAISGSVLYDGAANLSGIVVDLLDENGDMIATTTSDGNGAYTFENPPIVYTGTYVISLRLPLPDGVEAPPDIAVTLQPGESASVAAFRLTTLLNKAHEE